jgi:hypothetical protein
MMGSIKCSVTLVKEKNHDVITTHWFLHREVLVSKTIGEGLKQVLHVAVSMVNFIKWHPLKSGIFAKLCGSKQNDMWLSLNTQNLDGSQEEKFYQRYLSWERNYSFFQR